MLRKKQPAVVRSETKEPESENAFIGAPLTRQELLNELPPIDKTRSRVIDKVLVVTMFTVAASGVLSWVLENPAPFTVTVPVVGTGVLAVLIRELFQRKHNGRTG